jgi:hypothetical protein
MSKKVELIIEVDSQGNIKVTPKGTVGSECLELMAFLDKIAGITVVEVEHNSDMKLNNAKDSIKIQNKIK